MNSVHLIGRLATHVEVKKVNGGSKVSSLILTVDRNAEETEVALLLQRRTWRDQLRT
jgi:single-stranded DNA-binding protein